MNEKIKQAIKTIECFSQGNQGYWINAMNLSNAEKGFLVVHFGLNK